GKFATCRVKAASCKLAAQDRMNPEGSEEDDHRDAQGPDRPIVAGIPHRRHHEPVVGHRADLLPAVQPAARSDGSARGTAGAAQRPAVPGTILAARAGPALVALPGASRGADAGAGPHARVPAPDEAGTARLDLRAVPRGCGPAHPPTWSAGVGRPPDR